MDLRNLVNKPEDAATLAAELAAALWARGDLAYKLDETQVKIRMARDKALRLNVKIVGRPVLSEVVASLDASLDGTTPPVAPVVT